MKWWHALLGIIGIVVVSGFVVPPSIRCRFMIWNKNACSDIQTASKLLNTAGVNFNPDEPVITQVDEFAQGIKRTPVNRF